jgi:hypothetical protein
MAAIIKRTPRFAVDIKIERIDGRLSLIQWMLALLIGGVGSLIVKVFI